MHRLALTRLATRGIKVDPRAIQQARSRLEKAKSAVERMNSSTPLRGAEFEDAWLTFVMSAGAVYSKLEQGAKSNGQSSAWFGRMKHVRKTDPLLRYIHHARNAEEHSIDASTRTVRQRVPVPVSTDQYEVAKSEQKIGHGESALRILKAPEDGKLRIKTKLVSMAGIQLQRVKDRGEYFDPPTSHLDAPLADRSPKGVAEAAVSYLTTLIGDATNYVP